MKNIFKMIGVTALALVIGFGMTACGGDDSGGGGDGSFKFTIKNEHASLTITEVKVYETDGDWERKGGAKLTKTGLTLGNGQTSESYTASGFTKYIAGNIMFELEVTLSDGSTENIFHNPESGDTYLITLGSDGYLSKTKQ